MVPAISHKGNKMLFENTPHNVVFSADTKLEEMIAQARHTPVLQKGSKSQYYKILDYLSKKEEQTLTVSQIEFLLSDSMPPLGPSREDYMKILRRVIDSARKNGVPEILKKAYITIPFYDGHRDNARKEELINEGIEFFRRQGLYETVAELSMKLAWEAVCADNRRAYLDKALEYADKGSELYAFARATAAFFEGGGNVVSDDKKGYYFVYGQRIRDDSSSVILSSVKSYRFGGIGSFDGCSRYFPILKGYNDFWAPTGYRGTPKTILKRKFDGTQFAEDLFDLCMIWCEHIPRV